MNPVTEVAPGFWMGVPWPEIATVVATHIHPDHIGAARKVPAGVPRESWPAIRDSLAGLRGALSPAATCSASISNRSTASPS